jgi:glucose/arabinose dehydrogenase
MRFKLFNLVQSALTISVALLFSGGAVQAQPSSMAKPLAAPYATKSSRNPPQIKPWPDGRKPQAPVGFDVTIFADHLQSPRWLYVLPNGDVLVAEANTGVPTGLPADVLASFKSASLTGKEVGNLVLLLRDTKGNGVADQRSVFLKGLYKPFGMALEGDRLYVAETGRVCTYPYKSGDKEISEAGHKLFDLPNLGYNNHWTRDVVVDPIARKLYTSVGSGSNVDENGSDSKQPQRAAILQSELDGSNLRIFASGLRNPVGMAIEPSTKKLWATVNERDGLGDDLVPDYLTSVKDGGFYGWPFSYYGQNEDPRKSGMRPDLVKKAIVPDYQLGSHVAALGLCFYNGNLFPKSFKGGAFVGEHGSWNRSKRVGYKVVFIPFKNGEAVGLPDTGMPMDFLTGFIDGEDAQYAYGRPVGVAVAKDGALLVADDAGGVIWRVAPHKK